MALYNKYRPETLDAFLGNEETKESIRSMLRGERSKMPHTFLLMGPSGCGKATLSRMLAHELIGEGNPLNLAEIDAAHCGGIETIRAIRKRMQFKGFGGDVQVYKFEEVHTLTQEAQEALLKALEEPPDWAYIILCTTEPNKLLDTVKNGCTQFQVAPLSYMQVLDLLDNVCKNEGKDIPRENLTIIAEKVSGCPRQALVELEKVINLAPSALQSFINAKQPTHRSEIFKTFISQICDESSKGTWISFSELYEAFKEWCGENNRIPESLIDFSKSLDEHGYKSKLNVTFSSREGRKTQGKVILGLRLK